MKKKPQRLLAPKTIKTRTLGAGYLFFANVVAFITIYYRIFGRVAQKTLFSEKLTSPGEFVFLFGMPPFVCF